MEYHVTLKLSSYTAYSYSKRIWISNVFHSFQHSHAEIITLETLDILWKETFVCLGRNDWTLQCRGVRWQKIDLTHALSLFLSWVLSFRSGSGDRVWSPTVSEDGKTSPYTEPDSQVTTVYSGFTRKAQLTGVSSDWNSHLGLSLSS